jgi:hypothetical protein
MASFVHGMHGADVAYRQIWTYQNLCQTITHHLLSSCSLRAERQRSPVPIGRASRPFPRSKPDRRLSPHPAFQRRRCTVTRPYPFLTEPQWHQGHSPRLCPLWLQGQFRRSFSPPGSPSPCPEHDILAFGSYAASALLPTRWPCHVLWRGNVGEECPSSRTDDVSRSP